MRYMSHESGKEADRKKIFCAFFAPLRNILDVIMILNFDGDYYSYGVWTGFSPNSEKCSFFDATKSKMYACDNRGVFI